MPNTVNSLSTELTAVSGFDTNGNSVVATTTPINMTPIVGAVGTVTVTLTRKPSGSAAAVVSNIFTCDLPGLYIATVQQGSTAAAYRVLALPAAAFTTTKVNPALAWSRFVGPGDILQIMPLITPASAAASVELAVPGSLFGVDQRLTGGTSTNGLNWRAYGNDY